MDAVPHAVHQGNALYLKTLNKSIVNVCGHMAICLNRKGCLRQGTASKSCVN